MKTASVGHTCRCNDRNQPSANLIDALSSRNLVLRLCVEEQYGGGTANVRSTHFGH